MKNRMLKLIPGFLKPVLKKIYLFLMIDIIDRLKGQKKMLPPNLAAFVGEMRSRRARPSASSTR